MTECPSNSNGHLAHPWNVSQHTVWFSRFGMKSEIHYCSKLLADTNAACPGTILWGLRVWQLWNWILTGFFSYFQGGQWKPPSGAKIRKKLQVIIIFLVFIPQDIGIRISTPDLISPGLHTYTVNKAQATPTQGIHTALNKHVLA